MIDFHCHVDLYPDALKLLPSVNERNRFTFAVTTSPRAYLATSKVLAPYSRIRAGVGLHPEVATAKAQELDLLLDLIDTTRLVGEIGIDGTSRFKSSVPLQEKIFRAALDGCQKAGGRVMSIGYVFDGDSISTDGVFADALAKCSTQIFPGYRGDGWRVRNQVIPEHSRGVCPGPVSCPRIAQRKYTPWIGVVRIFTHLRF